MVANKPEYWDEYLDAVMFDLRTKKQMTTKFSPYYLMFGREARYPTEVPENFMVALEGKSADLQSDDQKNQCGSLTNIQSRAAPNPSPKKKYTGST
ncbi:hypothetical protein F7725_007745 [Dissostichus mawsoni]|uniref:Uncharacterized protein n=1 Tax=Dissostichus mawsoni TaxID=36200 RepID=A0A7J5Y598_DISMA|nr:hypothetical protein F7725_007745 [Dissostichus mawsoni]